MHLFHYIRKTAPITIQRFRHVTILIARELLTTEAEEDFRSQDIKSEWSCRPVCTSHKNELKGQNTEIHRQEEMNETKATLS